MKVNLAASLCVYRSAKNMIVILEKTVGIGEHIANYKTEVSNAPLSISHAHRPIWTEHVSLRDKFYARILIDCDFLSTLQILNSYMFLKETQQNEMLQSL